MTLNIYSPESYHEPAYIVGDRSGLEKLKALIEQTLNTGKASSVDFDSDGEGFEIRVLEDPSIITRNAPYVAPWGEKPAWTEAWGSITDVWEHQS